MSMHKPGFTLLEMLVYIALSILSISLLSMALGGIYTHIMSAITTTNQRIQVHVALKCMEKDIMQASSIVKCLPDQIIVCNSTRDRFIGWMVVANKLIRRCGVYDVLTHTWKQRISQKLAMGIASLDITQTIGTKPIIRIVLELVDKVAITSIVAQKIGVQV